MEDKKLNNDLADVANFLVDNADKYRKDDMYDYNSSLKKAITQLDLMFNGKIKSNDREFITAIIGLLVTYYRVWLIHGEDSVLKGKYDVLKDYYEKLTGEKLVDVEEALLLHFVEKYNSTKKDVKK